ncbi:MAG TPA: CHASE2 domain-containing protein [Thermodesulfobacteriota bacterium]|nr:CHASE2 domain-containing protein [Thermodesulfobacteriota bacterium]
MGIYHLDPYFLSILELKTLDARFLSRGKIPTSNQVVLVTIDEKSLDELGRWPWTRVRMAQVLDALVKAEVKVVGFDIVWAEPDENSQLKVLTEIKQKLTELKVANPNLERYIAEALQEADSDRILADSLARSQRAVLGYFFHFSPRESSGGQEGPAKEMPPLTSFNLVKFTSEEAARVPVFEAVHAEVNIPVISQAAEGAGYFNIFPDPDGTVRWAPLVIKYQDRFYSSLSLAVLQKFQDNSPLALRIAEYGVDQVRLGKVSIPANEEGRLLINYRGPQKTFPHYSATDVIHGRVPEKAFQGKIALVGATAIGIYDMRVTPFEHVYPGLEIHANVIDSILQNQFLYRPNWATLVDILVIAVVGLILGGLLPRFKAHWGALVGGALFLSVLALGQYLFETQGVWMNLTYPSLNLVFIYLGVTGYRYMTEEKEKKRIRGAFQYYLTASVVEEMLRNPDKLKLGGEKKDLTVLFSDIRGFTSISERMTPDGLVKFLNEYLTKMTDVVFKYDGLLDKYIGDAVMAVWGAPLDQPDHARRACLTALDMLDELHRLQKKWSAEGLPVLNIGIGVNAGPMVVGNMGSDRRFNYTVMGDSVNTGSRLEGLNKVYGTNIIVSQTTLEKVQEEFIARELDLVRVKGKGQPVKIFELLSLVKTASTDQRALADGFHAALAEYRKRNWDKAREAFQKVLAQFPHDGPAKLYLERSETLSKNPPPADWDGVYTMTTK